LTKRIVKSLYWCEIADAFQTAGLEAIEDYKLRDLAEIFNLFGSQISS